MSGVNSPNLPSVSFTSPGFLKFFKIPDMVWMIFIILGLKINYMGKSKTKIFKTPLRYIGDTNPQTENARLNFIHT